MTYNFLFAKVKSVNESHYCSVSFSFLCTFHQKTTLSINGFIARSTFLGLAFKSFNRLYVIIWGHNTASSECTKYVKRHICDKLDDGFMIHSIICVSYLRTRSTALYAAFYLLFSLLDVFYVDVSPNPLKKVKEES